MIVDDTIARSYIREISRRHILGKSISHDERRTFHGFFTAFPHLEPPVHVYCTQGDHAMAGGLLLFAGEPFAAGEVVGLRIVDDQWACVGCNTSEHVVREAVRLPDADSA
jgi:hypothetical protein